MYTLNDDGDSFEKRYWNAFLKNDFPEYEKYWSKYIIPLTNRPINIHFKTHQELLNEGYVHEDVCKAQLHFTVLRRLGRAFEILTHLQSKAYQTIIDTDLLAEGIFHIVAAQDVAFEFLQRMSTPNQFDEWAPNSRSSLNKSKTTSEDAQRKWRKDNNYPLQKIRDYRNNLAHGRILPSFPKVDKICLPKIGGELLYLDWRLVTDDNKSTSNLADFDTLDGILNDAWSQTIKYINDEWGKLNF